MLTVLSIQVCRGISPRKVLSLGDQIVQQRVAKRIGKDFTGKFARTLMLRAAQTEVAYDHDRRAFVAGEVSPRNAVPLLLNNLSLE